MRYPRFLTDLRDWLVDVTWSNTISFLIERNQRYLGRCGRAGRPAIGPPPPSWWWSSSSVAAPLCRGCSAPAGGRSAAARPSSAAARAAAAPAPWSSWAGGPKRRRRPPTATDRPNVPTTGAARSATGATTSPTSRWTTWNSTTCSVPRTRIVPTVRKSPTTATDLAPSRPTRPSTSTLFKRLSQFLSLSLSPSLQLSPLRTQVPLTDLGMLHAPQNSLPPSVSRAVRNHDVSFWNESFLTGKMSSDSIVLESEPRVRLCLWFSVKYDGSLLFAVPLHSSNFTFLLV